MPQRSGWEQIRLRFEHLEPRDAPAVLVWDQQTFDELAPGAVPANWQQWTGGTASTLGATDLKQLTGTQSLALTAPSDQAARIWNRDLMPGDFALAGDLLVDSLQPVEFFVRGRNLAGDTPTYYAVSITRGTQVQLVKVVDGITTVLASVQSTGYFSQTWLHLTVKPQGNKLAIEIYRPDTQQYLNSTGGWQAAAVDLFQVTDSSISGAGYIGVNRPAAYAGSVYVDDLQILSPPTAQNFDATPLGQLPPSWSQWTNTAGANFKTATTISQSAPQALASTSTASTALARAWLGAELAPNVQASTSVLLNSLVPLRLFARANNLGSPGATYYAAQITRGLQVSLLRVVNGVTTELGKINSAAYFSNQWVKLSLILIGDRIQALVYRPDTGEYLGPDGNWRAGLSRALDVRDSQITGVGFAGVERPALYAGTVTVDDYDARAAGGDTAPPIVTIDAPAAGATLTGPVTVKATAIDVGGVEHVEFYADGALRFAAFSGPYQWSFDSSAFANGPHTITVKAYDMAGNIGAATLNVTAQNDTLPNPIIPRHYQHIRVASLAYSGTPFTLYETNLLQNSIDLVIPHPSFLPRIASAAPNTPQLIYTNVSNIYEQLLTDWLHYADTHNLDRELAFYHASQPLAWSGASASSMPVNWFWAVFRSSLDKLTNYNTASRDVNVGDLPFGTAGESVYLGYPEKFRELNVNLFLGGSNGWKGVLEYATAVDTSGKPTQWQTLTTISDATQNFAKSGRIIFDPPADWVTASVGGSAPLYFLRVRTTVTGNPPVATSILGRNYSNSTGATVPAGTIPVFDYTADVNGDGYLSDAEFAHHTAGKEARFTYESRVFYPYYGQQRFVTNPASPGVQQWAADYQFRFLQANPLASGVFVDNSGGRNPLAGVKLVESTTSYSDDYGAMLNAISRRIFPKWVAANTSSGGAETDAVVRSSAMWIEEFAIRALAHSRQQFEELAAMVARRQALKSPAPFVVLDTLPTGGSPTDARTMIASLAYYYMLNDPATTFVMFNGGYSPNTSWTQHWVPAAAYDIGQPKGPFSVFATGKDPANTRLNYNVYQRRYDNALVLYKPLSYTVGVGTGTLADATATTHKLDGTYRVLSALGTLGAPVTSITLRNGEGVILIKA